MNVCVLQGVHVESTVMQPYPFYPLFFSERIPEVDPTMSAAIYGDLQAAGIMNATGFTSYPTDQPEDWTESAHLAFVVGPMDWFWKSLHCLRPS